MNKKLIVISLLFLVVITVAISQTFNDRITDVEVNKTSRDKLVDYGITSPQAVNLTCVNGRCTYKMFQELRDGSIYNLGKHDLNCVDLNRTECMDKQQVQISEWLNEYGALLKEREERAIPTPYINDTEIIISERR